MRGQFGTVVFSVLSALFASTIWAQDSVPQYKPLRPPASYEIHGRLDVAKKEIIASADIDLRRADTALADVWMVLPGEVDAAGRGKAFTLDSVLVNGAPVQFVSSAANRQFISIPVRRVGQGMPHLFLSFRTKVLIPNDLSRDGGTVVLSGWYPFVTGKPPGAGEAPGTPPSLLADYKVEMVVDSAFSLVGPGGLKNARERFGILPDKGDTLLYDITHAALERPIRQGPEDTYDWETNSSEAFEIAVCRRAIIDKAAATGLSLTIYSIGQDFKGRREVLDAGRRLLAYFVSQFGSPANDQFSAVYGSTTDEGGRFGNLIVLPKRARGNDIVIASLARQVAEQYFSPSVTPDSARGLPWAEGVAVYAATDALFALNGGRGYDMMARYGDWVAPPPKLGQPMTFHSAFGWMEALRPGRVQWARSDSIRYEQLFVVPSALYSIGALAGREKLRRALYQYSIVTRDRPSGANEFVRFMAERLGETFTPQLFTEWQQYGRRLDWSVQDITVQKTYTGAIVSGRIRRDGLRAMPVEIGITVRDGDTLSKSIVPAGAAADSPFIPFSIEILEEPVVLLLDPYQYLPDVNRENNLYVFVSGPVRIKSSAKEYPAFRRLERGE